jgi:hypothetical protein
MTVVEGPKSGNIVTRIQNILLKPADEWGVIDGEPATIQGLFTGYAAILALIPAVAILLGHLLLGFFNPIGALLSGAVQAVLVYALSLGTVYATGLAIEALAPNFDAAKDRTQAMKVAVYANTATWVGCILLFIPFLGFLIALAGFGYTCYLVFLGVGKVVKPPADKAVGLAAVACVIEFVIFCVAGWIVAIVGAMAFFGAAITSAAAH